MGEYLSAEMATLLSSVDQAKQLRVTGTAPAIAQAAELEAAAHSARVEALRAEVEEHGQRYVQAAAELVATYKRLSALGNVLRQLDETQKVEPYQGRGLFLPGFIQVETVRPHLIGFPPFALFDSNLGLPSHWKQWLAEEREQLATDGFPMG